MKMVSIKFVADYPALYIADIKCLIITDLHIGLETELIKSGIKIHKQIEKFKDILDKLIDLTGAKLLVILGDVKHKVPGVTMQELRDIPKFLDYLSKKVKVVIAKGNHDDYLETLVPSGVKIYSSKGFRIGRYGFFHGHGWPSKKLIKCDYLFIGHIQPSVEFRDNFGYRNRQQVWLKGHLNQPVVKKKYKVNSTGKLNIVVVPSFNNLIGSLNVMSKEDLSGPLLTNNAMNLEEMKVYLLDGTYLGEIKLLKKRFQKFLLALT